MADELQCWQMCSNAHWSQQHTAQLHNVKPTDHSNRRTTRSRNHHNQKHTEKSCKTANRLLGLIDSNINYKNTELMLPLYKSLVRPHVEYAVQFWSPHLHRDIDKIERVQRKASKIIKEIRNHSYQQQLKNLVLISVVQKETSRATYWGVQIS